MTLVSLWMFSLACAGKDSVQLEDDSAVVGDDSEPVEEQRPPVSELAELSSGECPDLSTSGTSTFLSSGEERKVTAVIPSGGASDAALVFFFHGLTSPSASSNPGADTARALDLQDLADTFGVVVLLPEAPLRNEFGQQFYLWDVEGASDHDLVLFDDLRRCAADNLDVDLWRATAAGFSGGALFTTIIASQRAGGLATFVEMSGGADVDMPIFDNPIAQWVTPEYPIPGLLFSGGENDAWPDPSLKLVDFEAASDTLEAHMVAGAADVVRCRHDEGHTVTSREGDLALRWLLAHEFGKPSPFREIGLGDDADWCTATFP